MRPLRIDQVVPSFAGRDAIGTHVLHCRDALRQAGYKSDIWAIHVLPEVKDQAKSLDEMPADPQHGTWLMYHHSIGTPAADVVIRRSEPCVLDYHNITPAHLVADWIPVVEEEVSWGRRQMQGLCDRSLWGLADSAYNERELTELGMSHTRVVPPLCDLASFDRKVDTDLERELLRRRSDGGSDWLFVGKVAPHKAPHLIVKALAAYRKLYDPKARLHLVGGGMGDDYPRAVERYAQRLGVGDALFITGGVTAEALAAYYKVADVFVCASEHEGFCVPVVEAMYLGVPVVARASAAVPETLGSGGLVLDDFSALGVAAAVHRIVSDDGVRQRLIEAGRIRAQDFSLARSAQKLVSALDEAAALADTGISLGSTRSSDVGL